MAIWLYAMLDRASSPMVVKLRHKRKRLPIDNNYPAPQPWHSQYEG